MKKAGMVVLAVQVWLFGCAPTGIRLGFGEPQHQETVFAVQTLRLARGDLDNYLRVNGDVRPSSSVDVLPEVAGRLTRLSVGLGDKVARNQVLAAVDPSRPGLEYVESPVQAPISGTVVALPFSVGATVGPQSPVLRLARTGDLEIVTNVAERHSAQMRVGLRATVTLEAFPGTRFLASVVSVSPVIDPLSRTLEVKLRFDQNTPLVRSGMFAEVRIVTETRKNIIRVPSEAVIDRFGETYVFLPREGGTAERRVVSTGLVIDNYTEILEGLGEGERLVIRGQTLLEEGSRIRVLEDAAGETP